MAICNGCGEQSSRIRITMTDNRGNLLPEDRRKEICQHCAPDQFQEPCDPFAKVWDEAAAKPYLYEVKSDGSLELKDSAKADVWAEMSRDQDEPELQKAIEQKRRTRRTRPMTAEEIQRSENAWRDFFRQKQQEEQRVLYNDQIATENMVLKHVRESEIERGSTRSYII